jgi:hypothetical protein
MTTVEQHAARTTGERRADELTSELARLDANTDETAERIRANYRDRRQKIQQDGEITELARRQKLDDTRSGTIEQMKALREEYASKQREAIESTQRTLLGTAPSDPARLQTFRQARHRARQLDDKGAALQAMRTALEDDDRELVEAIASHALDHGWYHVWRAWPEGGAGVEAISRARSGASGGRGQLFRFSV